MSDNYRNNPNYLAICDIPIEQLGLSKHALQTLKNIGVTNVGDCIDYRIRRHDVTPGPPEFIGVMETEVKEKLEEKGYWLSIYKEQNR